MLVNLTSKAKVFNELSLTQGGDLEKFRLALKYNSPYYVWGKNAFNTVALQILSVKEDLEKIEFRAQATITPAMHKFVQANGLDMIMEVTGVIMLPESKLSQIASTLEKEQYTVKIKIVFAVTLFYIALLSFIYWVLKVKSINSNGDYKVIIITLVFLFLFFLISRTKKFKNTFLFSKRSIVLNYLNSVMTTKPLNQCMFLTETYSRPIKSMGKESEIYKEIISFLKVKFDNLDMGSRSELREFSLKHCPEASEMVGIENEK